MSDLADRFAKLGRPRILVLGDLMLDRYTWGDAERVSPEAPVIVLRVDQEEIRPGGAASVAYLLRHLDAEVHLAGVIGDDPDGHTLRALLRDEGIDDQFVLVDSVRPTTSKQRLVGRASDRHPHQILRVDRESRTPIADQLAQGLWDCLSSQLRQFDAILIADYLKGVCTPWLLRTVIAVAREQGVPVLIDPGRLPDYERYRGATLLKPNRSEAELVVGASLETPAVALNAACHLCRELDVGSAIVTLDRDGMVAASPSEKRVIPAVLRPVYDITGAGDMVLATLGLSFAVGFELFAAASIANVAAGLQVERFGISPVSRAEIEAKLRPRRSAVADKIVTAEEIALLAEDYRSAGKRIVFTNGCFDLLHVGHLQSLEDAAALGEVLIVALNSDASVARLKGPSRPVIAEAARAQMLCGLTCVDWVVIFDEDSPHQLLRMIRPDVLAKGGTTDQISGCDVVEACGGKIYKTPAVSGSSTTQILKQIRSVHASACDEDI